MSRLARRFWTAWAAAALWPGMAAAAPPQPVLVTNTHKEAVPVRVMPEAPFHFQFVLDMADGQSLATSTYTVPAGKRLVVEYASFSAYLPSDGQTVFVRIVTTTGTGYATSDAFHTLHIQKREDYGALKQFEAAHTVRIYADPGTSVRVSLGRLPWTSLASGNVTLSGRLESVP
jgi:hypothetical protein